jgi:hypothetical protein
MSSVYSNAYLTIAAALAKDTTAGWFNIRDRKRYVRIKYTSPEGIDGEVLASIFPIDNETYSGRYVEMAHCPLVSRAWALQE